MQIECNVARCKYNDMGYCRCEDLVIRFKECVSDEVEIEEEEGEQMTFEEMKMKYREARENARESYRNEKIEWLKENGLYNGVIRTIDQKAGWLDVDFDGEIRFYPQKKDGTRSLNSSGYVSNVYEDAIKYQYRAKEGE